MQKWKNNKCLGGKADKAPLYGKYIKQSKKITRMTLATNVKGYVTIEETKPISKTKAWKLNSVDRKAIIG